MNKKFKVILRKINIWVTIHIKHLPVYRVTYVDGKRTYPLHYKEAKGCADTFNGKLWIDWEYADKLIYQK